MVRPVPAGRPDYTQSVPTELLLDLLSEFTFDELIPLLAVDRRWRAVALDSKPYWSFIGLDSLGAGAVSLFATRLSRTKERPTALIVNVRRAVQDVPALLATVLSALRAHLHHIDWLLVFLKASDASALWRSLDTEAPQLRCLELRCGLPTDGIFPVVPANLFSGAAPRLRSVTLGDIDLPVQPLPAFSKVIKFRTDYGTVRAVPDIFCHFPALETVDLPGRGTLEHRAFHTTHSYLKLRDCVLHSGRGVHTVPLPLPPISGLHFITIYNPLPEEIHVLLEPLHGPLMLTFLPCIDDPDDEFDIEIHELHGSSTRGRSIIDDSRFWSEYTPGFFLQRALSTALIGKLHTLSVDAPYWGALTRYVPPLPGLKSLRINVANERDVAALERTRFPTGAFRTLELMAPHCLSIAERDVAGFAAAVFASIPLRRTTLFLINVHLRGDQHRIGEMFKRTRIIHDAPCRAPDRSPPQV